jgi:hypothetical protein
MEEKIPPGAAQTPPKNPDQAAPVPPKNPDQNAPVPPKNPDQNAPVPPKNPDQAAPAPPKNPDQTAPAPPQNPDLTPDLGGKISELSEKIKSLEAENLAAKQNLALEKLLRNLSFSSNRAENAVKKELLALQFDGQIFKDAEKILEQIQTESPEFFKPSKSHDFASAMGKTHGTGSVSTLSEKIAQGFKK